MPLVQAKCTNCGANLQVDNTKDAAICPYCGSAYIVEKAINNYNVTNRIHANVVNVYGGNSADFVIRAGTLEKYTGAATEVTIPNSVKIIGYSAFAYCRGLEKITIPDSVVEIDDTAFSDCENLCSITIPESVKKIGKGAFNSCSNLKEITIMGNPILDGVNYSDPPPLISIYASEEWKRANCYWSECLKSYRPAPPSPSKSTGCYIATAVYGSYDCPEVWTLRRYRDYRLVKTWYGRMFIQVYYAVSPTLVKWFGNTSLFQNFFKRKLDRVICCLKEEGVEDSPYEDRPW